MLPFKRRLSAAHLIRSRIVRILQSLRVFKNSSMLPQNSLTTMVSSRADTARFPRHLISAGSSISAPSACIVDIALFMASSIFRASSILYLVSRVVSVAVIHLKDLMALKSKLTPTMSRPQGRQRPSCGGHQVASHGKLHMAFL
jgi:hypothetical protein